MDSLIKDFDLDVNKKDNFGYTVFHLACKQVRIVIVEFSKFQKYGFDRSRAHKCQSETQFHVSTAEEVSMLYISQQCKAYSQNNTTYYKSYSQNPYGMTKTMLPSSVA